MDRKKDAQKVTAIVPAYNEEKRLANVLKVVSTYGFKEVVVVDDCSTDKTVEVAKRYPIKIISHELNLGKAQAMNTGVVASNTDYLCFFDADTYGLNNEIIDRMIEPVVSGETEMFIAMRNRKIYFLRMILLFVPLLGGERALTKALWIKLPEFYKHKFRVEAGLNFFAKYYAKGFRYQFFKNFKQTIKEKKYGLKLGLKQRLSMMYDIMVAEIKLQFVEIPKSIRNQRLILFKGVTAMVVSVLGFTLLHIAWYGPRQFVEEAIQKKGATSSFLNWALDIATNITGDVLATLAIILIIINIGAAMLYLRRYLKILKINGQNKS